MFSSELCEIFKNTYFYRTPLAAASLMSKSLLKKKYIKGFFLEVWRNFSEQFVLQQFLVWTQRLFLTFKKLPYKYFVNSCYRNSAIKYIVCQCFSLHAKAVFTSALENSHIFKGFLREISGWLQWRDSAELLGQNHVKKQ